MFYDLDGNRLNRDERRRRSKILRRKERINSKITGLLSRCSEDILGLDILSSEEMDSLEEIIRNTTRNSYDYYPVPKIIHNKIRRYVHNHGCNSVGRSLLSIINVRVILGPPFNTVEGMLNQIRQIDWYTYGPFINHITSDTTSTTSTSSF